MDIFTKKYNVIILIIFILLALILIRQAQITPLDFDSSYNLMIVKNLLKNNTYVSSTPFVGPLSEIEFGVKGTVA